MFSSRITLIKTYLNWNFVKIWWKIDCSNFRFSENSTSNNSNSNDGIQVLCMLQNIQQENKLENTHFFSPWPKKMF